MRTATCILSCSASQRSRTHPGGLSILLALGMFGMPSSYATAQDLTPVPTSPPPTSQQLIPPLPIQKPSPITKPLAKSPQLAQISRELATRQITLREAEAVALALNPQLAQAGQNLLFAQGRTGEALSALEPNLSVAPGEYYINHIGAEGYALQATLPIDISHELTAATEQARFQEIAARLDINRVRNETVYGVENSFYGVLRSQALIKVSVQDLQNSLDRLRDAEVRYKAQAVTYLDVVRAQTDVANSEKHVFQARNSLSNAVASLDNSMGIDVSTPLRVSDAGAVEEPPGVAQPATAPGAPTNGESLTPAPPPSSMHPGDASLKAPSAETVTTEALTLGTQYSSVLGEALRTRPEILEADAQLAAAKKGILVAQRSVLPSFAVGVGYYDLRSTTGTPYNQPQAFVGLSIPVFDGGLARSRVQEARATIASSVTTRRQQVDSVSLDVQHAYLALVLAQDQVAVANQALAEAREAFELAEVRYNTGVSSRAGISPLIELSDAQVALTLAEQNQVNALYDYNAARAELDRAAGRLAFVGTGPGYPAVPSGKVLGR